MVECCTLARRVGLQLTDTLADESCVEALRSRHACATGVAIGVGVTAGENTQ